MKGYTSSPPPAPSRLENCCWVAPRLTIRFRFAAMFAETIHEGPPSAPLRIRTSAWSSSPRFHAAGVDRGARVAGARGLRHALQQGIGALAVEVGGERYAILPRADVEPHVVLGRGLPAEVRVREAREVAGGNELRVQHRGAALDAGERLVGADRLVPGLSVAAAHFQVGQESDVPKE